MASLTHDQYARLDSVLHEFRKTLDSFPNGELRTFGYALADAVDWFADSLDIRDDISEDTHG